MVKLAHREQSSAELVAWLNAQTNLTLFSSVLVDVELERALLRYDPAALPQVPAVLARLVRVELNAAIRSIAAAYRYPLLRTLDAIHLATACFVGATTTIDAFLAYDSRLLDFARQEQLMVVSPG